MIPTLFSVPLALLSFSLSVGARSTPAVAAIQHLSPRAIYQGGWPLALAGSASTTCPSDTPVLCDSKSVNPSCCPSGQTCIFGSSVDANYCCPTSTYLHPSPLNPHTTTLTPGPRRRLQHRCRQLPPVRKHHLDHVQTVLRRLLLLSPRSHRR